MSSDQIPEPFAISVPLHRPLGMTDFAELVRTLVPQVREFFPTGFAVAQITAKQATARPALAISILDPSWVASIAALPADAQYTQLRVDIRGEGNRPRILVTATDSQLAASLRPPLPRQAAVVVAAHLQRFDRGDGIGSAAASALTDPPILSTQPSLPTLGGPLRRGMVVDCYELVSRLGEGFSAEVWRARVRTQPHGIDLAVGQEIALKLYTLFMRRSTEILRIQREFSVASAVQHENLVRVFDLVFSPSRPWSSFMAMELVEGSTLKSLIPKRGMPRDAILNIGRQLAGALASLHEQSALHRDVKAANIIVADKSTWRVKLCDLGIVALEGDPELTGTSFLGSKHSAPLEQLSGERLDERADVYSLGSVLFNCFSGRPMYEGTGTEVAIARRMLSSNPETLASSQGSADDPLARVINRMISVDPADRPANAKEVVELLRNLQ